MSREIEKKKFEFSIRKKLTEEDYNCYTREELIKGILDRLDEEGIRQDCEFETYYKQGFYINLSLSFKYTDYLNKAPIRNTINGINFGYTKDKNNEIDYTDEEIIEKFFPIIE